MKREFLKELGIEDKEIINKILDENSADIGRAKGELETWKTKAETLENDIRTKDSTITNLQEQVDGIDALKQKITALETDKTNLTTQLNTEISKLQKAHAIESSVRDAKARNVKAVMALLDTDKITLKDGVLSGVTEQLEALTKGEDTSFLFGETQAPAPAGTQINNPPTGDNGGKSTTNSFADAVAKALGK